MWVEGGGEDILVPSCRRGLVERPWPQAHRGRLPPGRTTPSPLRLPRYSPPEGAPQGNRQGNIKLFICVLHVDVYIYIYVCHVLYVIHNYL